MKQYITVEQLNELSDKARDRLQEWWPPRLGDLYIQENSNDPEEVFAFTPLDPNWLNEPAKYPELCMYPLLSIGQMIEFLEEHLPLEKWEVLHFYNYQEHKQLEWSKKLGLCDALFEAVKEILETT